MKTNGFSVKSLNLDQAISIGVILPESMALWGSFENFQKLNYDNRGLKVFLMYYFEEIVAGLVFYEKNISNRLEAALHLIPTYQFLLVTFISKNRTPNEPKNNYWSNSFLNLLSLSKVTICFLT